MEYRFSCEAFLSFSGMPIGCYLSDWFVLRLDDPDRDIRRLESGEADACRQANLLESTSRHLVRSTFSSLTIAQLRERAHPLIQAIVLSCLADGSVIGPDRLHSFHKRRGH